MNSKQTEWKVGLFVLICLGVLGLMMVKLSKGISGMGGTYEFTLTTVNIGGIQENAAVRLAGVRIGQITSIDYDSDRMQVVLKAQVGRNYRIPSNAVFTIETSGFLGEQFVAITPQGRATSFVESGSTVSIREPFNLQEAARNAMNLVDNVNHTVSNLNSTLVRIDRLLLNDNTIANLTNSVKNIRVVTDEAVETIGNFRSLSERAVVTMDGVDALVRSNSPAISASLQNIENFSVQIQAVTNLIRFSEQLNLVGADIRQIIQENRSEVDATMENFQTASASMRRLMKDLEEGRGLAGSLLKDPVIDQQTSLLLSNLTVLSSNLNRFGLLYKPKAPKNRGASAPTNMHFNHKPIF